MFGVFDMSAAESSKRAAESATSAPELSSSPSSREWSSSPSSGTMMMPVALPSCVNDEVIIPVREDGFQSLGLKWEEIGPEKPQKGIEISNLALHTALLNKRLEFSCGEFASFEVYDLSAASYIRAGDRYFKPAYIHNSSGNADLAGTTSQLNSDLACGISLPSAESSSRCARIIKRLPRQDHGKDKVFDIFLSYRVNADSKLVESLYDKLKSMEVIEGSKRRPLRVFWDKVCLIAGKDFESGFSQALCNSRLVVFIMSRKAYQNIDTLTENSSCDNFILEHALTLELFENKRVSAVLPLFVGDLKSYEGVGFLYSNFFQSGCLPNIPDIVLSSVQEKVGDYLSQLEIKVSCPRTLNQIFKEITQFQGAFLEGAERPAIENAVSVIHECANRQLSEESDTLQLKQFRFSSPLGQEVIFCFAVKQLHRFYAVLRVAASN